jgi:hypothetical protein
MERNTEDSSPLLRGRGKTSGRKEKVMAEQEIKVYSTPT